ncbi:putative disease resistance protein RGA3 [Salvia hispanica]|uniref:putative disease resistance protein RGA3 n=1 Tax=Salvia hispanica TaxID=49212 RepID=UPI002009C873|nr:putative disease resistance protein RGA3 [Salvia hispanica]
MADAVISVVVERVATIIQDQIRYEVNLVRGVEKELLHLSDKLRTVRNVLDDAEKRGVKDQSVKSWLKKLENTAYEMDDILDEWDYYLLKHKMKASVEQKVCCSFIPSSSLYFKKVSIRRDTGQKIENVKVRLDQILKEKDDFEFVTSLPPTDHPVPNSCRVQSTSFIEFEKVRGSDVERNKGNIVKKLLSADTQILSIVGTGGIGKTTLAQLVYNDAQVTSCFELRIWICVSDPFDLAAIAKGIIGSVTKEIIPLGINQLELILEKLGHCISGKKFLLVLDDVWTEKYNEWEPLKINLRKGAVGSKILVTTRKVTTAKMMGTLDNDIYRPKQLSDEECWSLLRGISLSGRDGELAEFESVGKKIATKCSGLPLAANVLGRLLQFKYNLQEWEDVEKSEIWQLENAEVDLFPHLVLSYKDLSPPLKRCFSYCAVYPKDHKIRADRLIAEWMALGYLGSVSGNGEVELKGRQYLNNLAMRSLFQDNVKIGEQIIHCKMHDIVHDFAVFLRKNDNKDEVAKMRKESCQVCDPLLVSQAKEYRSLFMDKSRRVALCDCISSVRVLGLERGFHDPLLQGMEKLIHVRCLELSDIELKDEDLKNICRLYFLQTLLLSHCYLINIPGEIGDLVHLRNLDLSRNGFTGLPESICRLVELQTLNLESCDNLYKLPEGIRMLENLQHIFVDRACASQGRLVKGVAQLSGLRTFGYISSFGIENLFRVQSGPNKFKRLKHLNHLTGSLRLEILCNTIPEVEELARTAGEAELRKKIHIHSLRILFLFKCQWKYHSGHEKEHSRLSLELIEALQPHPKLSKLEIEGYAGYQLPRWMSSPLNFVKHIHLFNHLHLSSLTPMGKLPLLEDLILERLNKMEFLGREFLGIVASSSNHVVVFPKLKKLAFNSLICWDKWEDITVEEEESAAISIMPCLTELHITDSVSLKKLPHRLLHKASSSLRWINIVGSSELVKTYGEDKEGSAWRSISQHNPQLQLHI